MQRLGTVAALKNHSRLCEFLTKYLLQVGLSDFGELSYLEREGAPDGDDDGPPLEVDGDEERGLPDVHVVPSS